MMLASRWTGQDVAGWWQSEKLDGCRAFWDKRHLRTKDSWTIIDAPEWFTAELPRDRALDGELFAGRGTFELVRVLVQFARSDDPRWKDVSYRIFDLPTTRALPVERRWEQLGAIKFPKHVRIVEQVRCPGGAAARKAMTRVVAKGGEGLMLRMPGHFYEFGRSGSWLKVKPAGID